MILSRSIVIIVTAMVLAGCAGTGNSRGSGAASTLPQVPTEEVFITGVRDVCFGSLDRNISHAALADIRGFRELDDPENQYRDQPGDVLYNAVFTSAPILLSVGDGGTRCSVIAIRGDFSELKYLTELEIERFSEKYGPNAPDHIAFVTNDILQTFEIKFTLLSGAAVAAEEE